MNQDHATETWMKLMLVSIWYSQVFEKITGMTLDEWDERNYQRIMNADGRSA